MKIISIVVVSMLLTLPAFAGESPAPTGTRSFYMGFTGFVYDYTPAAVAATHKFVRENGDILAHHIEGVPWKEALSGEPFPAAMLKEWQDKKSAAAPGMKIYLAISPGAGTSSPPTKAARSRRSWRASRTTIRWCSRRI